MSSTNDKISILWVNQHCYGGRGILCSETPPGMWCQHQPPGISMNPYKMQSLVYKWVNFSKFSKNLSQNWLKFRKIWGAILGKSWSKIGPIGKWKGLFFLENGICMDPTFKFPAAHIHRNQIWVPPGTAIGYGRCLLLMATSSWLSFMRMGYCIWNLYTPCRRFTASLPQGECADQMD